MTNYLKVIKKLSKVSGKPVWDLTFKEINDFALNNGYNTEVLYNCWVNVANNPKTFLN